MLSFCLRVILWCFSFVKAHYKWFLFIHSIYAVLISYYINSTFETHIMVYNMIPQKMKKKYAAFMINLKHVKKWQLILGAIYLLPIRLTMLFATLYTT